MSQPQTVPCAYKTGRTLGQGTYAVVKEAVHIKTGKYYACKVISKRLMEGREHMVRNEIAALKKVSQGHRSIVTLVDYFETMNNLYLVTDLCVGGELFDRICERGSYYEQWVSSPRPLLSLSPPLPLPLSRVCLDVGLTYSAKKGRRAHRQDHHRGRRLSSQPGHRTSRWVSAS